MACPGLEARGSFQSPRGFREENWGIRGRKLLLLCGSGLVAGLRNLFRGPVEMYIFGHRV